MTSPSPVVEEVARRPLRDLTTPIDVADVPPAPWKNGAGSTRELATGPGWRLSLADLVAQAPFSFFPGQDRIHLPLEGGYTLVIDDVEHPARALEPIAFPGEAAVVLRSLDRPTTALNLMTRRDQCRGALVVDGTTVAVHIHERTKENQP
ncbi:MAG: HutD family protein [Nocardioides sp.]|uniref:HutD/Ves family protein n=1 Tax=Nocardioides sp. TaxID=35761 RepID=UPI0039E68A84